MKIGGKKYAMDNRPKELLTLKGVKGWWTWVSVHKSGLEAHEAIKGYAEFKKYVIIHDKSSWTYQVWGVNY